MNPTAAALIIGTLIAGPVGAQEEQTGVRLSVPSFVFARWASRSASSLYAGYTMGPVGGFVGLVVNPRSGYREMLGGAVSRVGYRRQAVMLGVAYADATESKYLQAYVVPSLLIAGASVSGTIEFYIPLEHTGIGQVDINPVAVILHPVTWLGVGGAYAAGMADGDRPLHRVGPTVEFGIPRGSVKAELLRNLTLAYYEVRMSVEAAF
jgi:hypothetical protein